MIKKIQLCMFFAFGVISWHGVSAMVVEAKTHQQIALLPVMSLEQLTKIPVSEL